MPSTPQTARRLLGDQYGPAMALLARGLPVREIGRRMGLDPRVISAARPRAVPPPGIVADSGLADDPAAQLPKTKPGTMRRYRRLLNRHVPLQIRAELLAKASRSGNSAVAIRALERIDDLSGFMPSKQQTEAQTAAYPPLFAMGAEPECAPPTPPPTDKG